MVRLIAEDCIYSPVTKHGSSLRVRLLYVNTDVFGPIRCCIWMLTCISFVLNLRQYICSYMDR
jgi:hypothetical protein